VFQDFSISHFVTSGLLWRSVFTLPTPGIQNSDFPVCETPKWSVPISGFQRFTFHDFETPVVKCFYTSNSRYLKLRFPGLRNFKMDCFPCSDISHFRIFCHAIIFVLLVLPLSLVHHRRAELSINEKQILYLLSSRNKYANNLPLWH
jgi:hypothetical protein